MSNVAPIRHTPNIVDKSSTTLAIIQRQQSLACVDHKALTRMCRPMGFLGVPLYVVIVYPGVNSVVLSTVVAGGDTVLPVKLFRNVIISQGGCCF